MKVYFEASIAGKEQFSDRYRLIIDELKAIGCRVSQSMMNVDVATLKKRRPEQDGRVYKQILKSIKTSDVFVCELTYNSPGVAMEVQDAVYRYKKPSLVLYHDLKKGRLAAPFRGNPSKLLFVEEYNEKTLKSVLKKFLQRAEKQIPSERFTVRMTEELNDYVEYLQVLWKETSKNKVVKRVLYQKMSNDEAYQKFLEERNKEL